MIRAIVLTSTFGRHRFVVHRLAQALDLVGVWQEEKSFRPERYAQTREDGEIIERHFQTRDRSEAEYFGEAEAVRVWAGTVRRLVSSQGCNEASEIDVMRRLEPEVVLVFGTGILKRAFIETFRGRIINLHLGLSPYYRGAGTNFWPLVNRKPEYVGATIHYLDEGIDTGPIIAHVRPEVRCDDGPHDVGNRVIVAGAALLAQTAIAHVEGGLVSTPQAGAGRLYQRKDFSADAVRRLYSQFETGMIEEYLEHKTERDAKVPLLGLSTAASGRAVSTNAR